jgi:hypothetical protein
MSTVKTITRVFDSASLPLAITQRVLEDDSASKSPPLLPGAGQAQNRRLPPSDLTSFEPPPSPITAYYVECDAYHFVGVGDLSSHEISGCGDPRGGTTAIYPTISECQRALDALTLQPIPYGPNYVKGLYSDYTRSKDDF